MLTGFSFRSVTRRNRHQLRAIVAYQNLNKILIGPGLRGGTRFRYGRAMFLDAKHLHVTSTRDSGVIREV